MFEIMSQMVVCLFIAALIGYIIGFISATQESPKRSGHDDEKSKAELKLKLLKLKAEQEARFKEEAKIKVEEEANKPDDITRIKGLGPKSAKALETMGITTFAQIIALSDEEKLEIAKKIHGRLNIDEWANQAKKIKEEDAKQREN
ncbi:MAG: hypothetical protein JXQ76_04415 [Campylobacterales bacterium]|nr:hypothetical protein [Campylobacterales bacterium]